MKEFGSRGQAEASSSPLFAPCIFLSLSSRPHPPLHPPVLYGDWSVVGSVPSEEEGWMKIVSCSPKQWGKQLFYAANRPFSFHRATHTCLLVVWFFFSTIFRDATHISVNHKKVKISGSSNLICLLSHQGWISSTFFFFFFFCCSWRCYLACVFYFTCASWRPGKNQWRNRAFFVLLSSDYFTLLLFFFPSRSNWKK